MTAACVLAAALVFTPADAGLACKTAKTLVERHTPRDAGTPGGSAAADFIRDAASATGANVVKDRFQAQTPKGLKWFANLEGEYTGGSAGDWIVLVSHYDTKSGVDCPGANDGASTSGLLVAVSSMLFRERPKDINVLMIWTDGEECMNEYCDGDGFWGSRRAAGRLKASGRRVRYVLCLDMLGDRDLNIVIPRNGTPSLRRLVMKVAELEGLSSVVSLTDDLVKDDHVPFLRQGFSAVDIIDFEYGSKRGLNDYWHTRSDTMDKLSETSLHASGRLVAGMLSAGGVLNRAAPAEK